jgi:hypothetical protein
MGNDRRFVKGLKLPVVCGNACPLRAGTLWCGTLVFLSTAVLAGCGDRSQVAPVTGRVRLDGRPLEHAEVTFQPDGSQRPSIGRTDADGRYELAYKRGQPGAIVGEHTVRIYVSPELVAKPPRIPARYDTQSELRVEVAPGQVNVFNFDLQSDEE